MSPLAGFDAEARFTMTLLTVDACTLHPVTPEPVSVSPEIIEASIPVGCAQVSLLAVVQYSNFIDPSAVPRVGMVKVNLWFTLPPGIEPPTPVTPTSVSVRAVICAAFTVCLLYTSH